MTTATVECIVRRSDVQYMIKCVMYAEMYGANPARIYEWLNLNEPDFPVRTLKDVAVAMLPQSTPMAGQHASAATNDGPLKEIE